MACHDDCIIRKSSDLLEAIEQVLSVPSWKIGAPAATDEERDTLIRTLETQGNHGLAAALGEQEATGWVSFDPRGGGGPGRDPRRADLKYAREIEFEDRKEIVLITNHYPGYGTDPQAADGAKLAEYPVSFVLLKIRQDEDGEWTGIGRMFVGAKLSTTSQPLRKS